MRALSIRQPYAELILRGIKTVELADQTVTDQSRKLRRVVPGNWRARTGL